MNKLLLAAIFLLVAVLLLTAAAYAEPSKDCVGIRIERDGTVFVDWSCVGVSANEYKPEQLNGLNETVAYILKQVHERKAVEVRSISDVH